MQISDGKVINITTGTTGYTGTDAFRHQHYEPGRLYLFRYAVLILTEKKDFEGYLFPILAQENRLFAFGIPGDCWYPVNNPKEYDNLLKRLQAFPGEIHSFNK